MGTFHKAFWVSDGGGQTRKERRGGSYRYYVPSKLAGLALTLDTDVVSDVVRAEKAIQELNNSVRFLLGSEGLARFLLRAEAVASSYIEGLQIGTKRLLRAELDLARGTASRSDETAIEILGSIYAMEDALVEAQTEKLISVDTIKRIHCTLLKNTRIEEYGGVVRAQQNWIGGNWHNPLQAEFVPPAPEYVEDLLEDLAHYCNQELVSPVQQAALAHAQFETIHPFVDGNGRAGRALIHLLLRRRGLTPAFVPPISLVLATFSKSYVEGLTAFRFEDSADSGLINERLNEWLSFFAGTCVRACKEAQRFEAAALRLRGVWLERLGAVRKGSTAELLLDELIGMPVFTYQSLCEATGRSLRAVSEAVTQFEAVGIVKPLGKAQRKQSFEVPEILKEFNIFERQLASPAGNTATEKPTRPVPYRINPDG